MILHDTSASPRPTLAGLSEHVEAPKTGEFPMGKRKDVRVEDIIRNIDGHYRTMITRYIGDLHSEISSLDAQNERTLPLAISSLTKIEDIDQNDIAAFLGQSRVQVGRWSREEHIPRNATYRAFLVGELLRFMREKVDTFAKAA